MDVIFKEIQSELAKIERPNFDPDRVAAGEYKEHITMSVAGGKVPVLKGYCSDEIETWFGKLNGGLKKLKSPEEGSVFWSV